MIAPYFIGGTYRNTVDFAGCNHILTFAIIGFQVLVIANCKQVIRAWLFRTQRKRCWMRMKRCPNFQSCEYATVMIGDFHFVQGSGKPSHDKERSIFRFKDKVANLRTERNAVSPCQFQLTPYKCQVYRPGLKSLAHAGTSVKSGLIDSGCGGTCLPITGEHLCSIQ